MDQKQSIAIWKKIGETPLEALNRLRLTEPEYVNATLSYAGRLDPAAQGVMLVLVDDGNKERERYLGLNKKYEVEILFGISTDTYDLLGKISDIKAPEFSKIESPAGEVFKKKVEATFSDFIGKINQAYPPYSSKTIDGKALFAWAREGAVKEMPTHEIEIFSIESVGWSEISGPEARSRSEKIASAVKGDFRQKEINQSWKQGASMWGPFPVLKILVSCGSGAYVRVLAHDMGIRVGMPALACSIVRTEVGDFTKEDCLI